MNYYSHILHFPNAKPFDRSDFRWAGFVGAFAGELMKNREDLFWFSYYGGFARFRLYTDSYDKIRPEIESLAASLGLGLDDSEKGSTLVGDLGWERFLAPDSSSTPERRAKLVLQYLHSISSLMIDNVRIGQEGYWERESSQNGENPHKNNFESLGHLLANMTQFEFDVQVSVRTIWMQKELGGSVKLHL